MAVNRVNSSLVHFAKQKLTWKSHCRTFIYKQNLWYYRTSLKAKVGHINLNLEVFIQMLNFWNNYPWINSECIANFFWSKLASSNRSYCISKNGIKTLFSNTVHSDLPVKTSNSVTKTDAAFVVLRFCCKTLSIKRFNKITDSLLWSSYLLYNLQFYISQSGF